MVMSETPYPLAGKRVWVAGHRGMVGRAVVERLEREGCRLLTVGREVLDLRRQGEVEEWMGVHRPQAVVVAAARVGGIVANDTWPAHFLYDNLLIAANVIHGAWRVGVEKLLFLGSSCIYPRLAPQPMVEGALLTGPLEPTNQWYAVAKIAGIKLCQAYRRQYGCDFISAMPTNLYGPHDNFDLTSSHVVPALMRKLHQARLEGAAEVEIWGSGKPMREFLHVNDLADALVHLLVHYSDAPQINVGSGEEISIAQLARLMARVVGYGGEFRFDAAKPDGAPRKLLDVGRLQGLGWRPAISLEAGLKATYDWYLAHSAAALPTRGVLT